VNISPYKYEYEVGELSVLALNEVLHDEVCDKDKPLTLITSPLAVHS